MADDDGQEKAREPKTPRKSLSTPFLSPPFKEEQNRLVSDIVEEIESRVLSPLMEGLKRDRNEYNRLRWQWIQETVKSVWKLDPDEIKAGDSRFKNPDPFLSPFAVFFMASDPARRQHYYLIPHLDLTSRFVSLRAMADPARRGKMNNVKIPWGRGIVGEVTRDDKPFRSGNLFRNLRLTFKNEDITLGNRSIIMTPIHLRDPGGHPDPHDPAEWLIGVFSPVEDIFGDDPGNDSEANLKRVVEAFSLPLRLLHRFYQTWQIGDLLHHSPLSQFQDAETSWRHAGAALVRSHLLRPDWAGIWTVEDHPIRDDERKVRLVASQRSPFTDRREVFATLRGGKSSLKFADWLEAIELSLNSNNDESPPLNYTIHQDRKFPNGKKREDPNEKQKIRCGWVTLEPGWRWHPLDTISPNPVPCSAFVRHLDGVVDHVVLVRHDPGFLKRDWTKLGERLERALHEMQECNWSHEQEDLQTALHGFRGRTANAVLTEIGLDARIHSLTVLVVYRDTMPFALPPEDLLESFFRIENIERQYRRIKDGIIPKLSELDDLPHYPLSEFDELPHDSVLRTTKHLKVVTIDESPGTSPEKTADLRNWCARAFLYLGFDVKVVDGQGRAALGGRPRKGAADPEDFYRGRWKEIWSAFFPEHETEINRTRAEELAKEGVEQGKIERLDQISWGVRGRLRPQFHVEADRQRDLTYSAYQETVLSPVEKKIEEKVKAWVKEGEIKSIKVENFRKYHVPWPGTGLSNLSGSEDHNVVLWRIEYITSDVRNKSFDLDRKRQGGDHDLQDAQWHPQAYFAFLYHDPCPVDPQNEWSPIAPHFKAKLAESRVNFRFGRFEGGRQVFDSFGHEMKHLAWCLNHQTMSPFEEIFHLDELPKAEPAESPSTSDRSPSLSNSSPSWAGSIRPSEPGRAEAMKNWRVVTRTDVHNAFRLKLGVWTGTNELIDFDIKAGTPLGDVLGQCVRASLMMVAATRLQTAELESSWIELDKFNALFEKMLKEPRVRIIHGAIKDLKSSSQSAKVKVQVRHDPKKPLIWLGKLVNKVDDDRRMSAQRQFRRMILALLTDLLANSVKHKSEEVVLAYRTKGDHIDLDTYNEFESKDGEPVRKPGMSTELVLLFCLDDLSGRVLDRTHRQGPKGDQRYFLNRIRFKLTDLFSNS